MTKSVLVGVLALLSTIKADPAWIIKGSPFYPTPYTSAALVAAAAAPVIAPVAPVSPVSPVAPFSPVAPVASVAPVTPVASVAPAASVASVAALPYTSVSQYNYAYGTSLSYSDYLPIVNSAYSLPYSLPYAYAASRDWYYRK